MTDALRGPARLLVADDNKVNRLLLARSLELQGHSVACAANGKVALEMLREGSFDLMLLDMEMPEMDGFQVLEQLTGDRALRDLPESLLPPRASTTSCAAAPAPRILRRAVRRAQAHRAARRSALPTAEGRLSAPESADGQVARTHQLASLQSWRADNGAVLRSATSAAPANRSRRKRRSSC